MKGFPDAKLCSFNTLGLGERTVYFWIDNADDGLPRKPTERQQAARDPAKIESATEFCPRCLSIIADQHRRRNIWKLRLMILKIYLKTLCYSPNNLYCFISHF